MYLIQWPMRNRPKQKSTPPPAIALVIKMATTVCVAVSGSLGRLCATAAAAAARTAVAFASEPAIAKQKELESATMIPLTALVMNIELTPYETWEDRELAKISAPYDKLYAIATTDVIAAARQSLPMRRRSNDGT
jgi:hypothetical protein